MDSQGILALTVEGLREKLTGLGLATTGLKSELQQRLLEHFGLTSGDSASEYDDVASGNRVGTVNFERSVFTLRDIEDSLTSFCGTDNIDINNWLEDFEDNAEAVAWNQLQRFIYAKQLLKGAAKIFVRSQSGIKNWGSLKEALIGEFGCKLASADIHRMLKDRRKKNSESFREYLYILMEIGKPIKLDEESLIQYFVEGIPDSKFGKSILYQASNIEDLKNKLKTYEKIRGSGQQAPFQKPSTESRNVKEEKPSTSAKRKCYKCGQENHMAKECKSSTIKCFKCGKSGHKSFECKSQTQPEVKKENSNSCMVKSFEDITEEVKTTANRSFKSISINGVKFSAIIDTGCDISIIRYDVFRRLGDVVLTSEKRDFITAGDYILTTIGYFYRVVEIDGDKFNIKFFVAENFVYPAAIGNDLLQQADLIMSSEGTKLVKKEKESSTIKDLHEPISEFA